MLAAFIIFGYLGYFCQKYDLKIDELEISGPGLLFITMPACLSTMFYPQMWVLLFFLTMLLIGVDSQFGLVEAAAYFLEDLNIHFRGKPIPPSIIKVLVCLCGFIAGLPVATKGGTYVLELYETFGYAIPASLTMVSTIIVFSKIL